MNTLVTPHLIKKWYLQSWQVKNQISPGVTGVTTNMLKNRPPEGFTLLTKKIQCFWNESDCDFEPWHVDIQCLSVLSNNGFN